MQETIARAGETIYAGDTNMIAEPDTVMQISQKLINYAKVTVARNVKINWGKVLIIARKRAFGTNSRTTAPF